ncbi:MAG: lecithin retinol acyltransferase family protein [Bacteroidia bacterium]
MNHNTNHLIKNLRQGDVVQARRKGVNLINHFIYYAGVNKSGEPVFIGNLINGGVQYLKPSKLKELLTEYRFDQVRRFTGTQNQREDSVRRAISQIGRPYNLLTYNCENFVNYAQFGMPSSPQVSKSLNLLIGLVLITGIIKLAKS